MIFNKLTQPHFVLIGAGIMSATLGVMLKELMPDCIISIYERLDKIGQESSDAWNNAGTGHSAFCELNYTPEFTDGTIDISKALKIASSFELSKSFWSYLVAQQYFDEPQNFINQVPHHSFVWGEKNVQYLKKRFDTLKQHPLFEDLEFSTDREVLTTWFPLIMQSRNQEMPYAATRMKIGTDVNFGNLTRALFKHLEQLNNVTIYLSHEVRDLSKTELDTWEIKVKNLLDRERFFIEADFVFIGAGGGALPLLEKSDISEAEGYGGFPVSGQWLICQNEAIINQHHAKVYGMAAVGAPPMSVPHLDTRFIDGKKELLFGPFAGFSTKFLKNGSYFDLPKSIEFENILVMMSAGIHNLPLTKYLIEQVTLSAEDRMEALREYFPNAQNEDWVLAQAGQRVQVIKKGEDVKGKLEFGTEIIVAADGSLAALLGASPGASTAVKIILDVLKKCFPEQMQSENWKGILKKMVPVFDISLVDNSELCKETRANSAAVLQLNI